MKDRSLPLHEIVSRIVAPEPDISQRSIWGGLGTMQKLNQRLVKQPTLDFINYNLRGIGQVIFVNNPLSGLLILLALLIQSPWIGLMSLLGVISSTVTAIALKLDRETIRNGIYGYNGILVGAALATFGSSGNGNWSLAWALAIVVLSALTTIMMKTFGVWWASTFKSPPLTLPFNLVTLLFLSLITSIPQSLFQLGTPTVPTTSLQLNFNQLLTALPIGFGQVFLADKIIVGSLILLAVALCTPLGAFVGLLGAISGILIGLAIGIIPADIYAGLWGYNSVLAAMAIGGVFYAPNWLSLLAGLACALLCALIIPVLTLIAKLWRLPVLTLPFCLVTIGFFVLLRRSLPSLVPVALHAVTSPEEHRQRYLTAKEIISNFRRQLTAAINGQETNSLFTQATDSVKGDLRYIYDAIDADRSGELSTQELAAYLVKANQITSQDELVYLFNCMDKDKNGAIDFQEFGELMLRHRRLMNKYEAFTTYFLPIDANKDNLISISEMNVAMNSVREKALSQEEVDFLQRQIGKQSLTWNQFIELLLLT